MLYFGIKKNNHDSQIVNVLNKIENTREFYLNNSLTVFFTMMLRGKNKILVFRGLDNLFLILTRRKKKFNIGICMAKEINDSYMLKRKIIKFNLSKIDLLIVDSSVILNKIREEFGFTGKVILMNYTFSLEEMSTIPLSSKRKVDVFIGRNSSRVHNTRILFKIIKKMNKQDLNFTIVKGKNRTIFYLLSKVYSNVFLVDSLDRQGVVSQFEKCQVYLSTSLSDGTSVMLLEAMASGRICVVSDFESNKEWVKDGISGFLFHNNDYKSLIKVLDKIINLTQNERYQISDNARNYVFEKTRKNHGASELRNIVIKNLNSKQS
jgi:glycosyltransferase involved in cell wall biosynthesis